VQATKDCFSASNILSGDCKAQTKIETMLTVTAVGYCERLSKCSEHKCSVSKMREMIYWWISKYSKYRLIISIGEKEREK